MKKKLTILLPLYLAGAILLAFVVFPHHHHDNYICFNTHHSASEENPDHHRHGPFSEKGGCVDHLFQTQLNNNSGRNLQDDNATSYSHIPFLDCLLSEIIGISLYQADSLGFPATQDENLYAFLLISSRATRAPPTC